YISAWRLQVDAIPATDVAASHATLNPSSSDNSGLFVGYRDSDQTDVWTDFGAGALQSWAFDKLCGSDKYRVTKLEPVIMEILNELKVAVRPFIYNAYNVAFDPNVMLNESYVISRRANVGHLLTNDEFLYGQLWVDGVHVKTAFASPAILKLASYLLRDGPTQYHRYIKGLEIKPLLAVTATLCRWALQEHKMGRYITSLFVPEMHRVHHNYYVSLLESLPPSHLVLLTALLLSNNSVLTQ
ncbi:hypothetical protein EDD22DRAFT_853065, partial [Suillus occidentalis]